MGTCIIVSAGDLKIEHFQPEPESYVIAADGGYAYCEKLGIVPDLILGDFDSLEMDLTKKVMESSSEEDGDLKVLPSVKDDTDTMAAVRIGLDKGYRSFVILGALGGERLSHTIANLQTLEFLHANGAKGQLLESRKRVSLICDEEVHYPQDRSGFISIFAYGGEAVGVTLQGLKYELVEDTLTPAFPLGVSNEFMGKEAVVRVRKGKLLVIEEGPIL